MIDDDRTTLKRLGDVLEEDEYSIHTARTAEEGWRLFNRVKPDVVLVDPHVPHRSDLELLRQLRRHADEAELLFLTRPDDDPAAVVTPEKADAKVVIDKPVDPRSVRSALQRVLRRPSGGTDERTDPASDRERTAGALVGESAPLRDAVELARSVADTDASVLILGESGTGKELLADYLVAHSARAGRRFQKINCAALPRDLIESELFGHRKGAFTGAAQDRPGVLEDADGGSLLLDEIGEMPPMLQTKLLRVLQEREFRPVGATRAIHTDFRLICTTNVDVPDALESGRLREDLYYRISTVTIRLPSLRERPGDVPILAQHFLEKYSRQHGRQLSGFTPAADDALARCEWPGNVRQLEHAIEHAVILSTRDDERIDVTALPRTIIAGGSGDGVGAPVTVPADLTLAELERLAIEQALRRHDANKQEAARALGIHRATLYSKMRKHGIAGIAHRGAPAAPVDRAAMLTDGRTPAAGEAADI